MNNNLENNNSFKENDNSSEEKNKINTVSNSALNNSEYPIDNLSSSELLLLGTTTNNEDDDDNSDNPQDLPEFYIEKLSQRTISSKSLTEHLLSLRIVLSSANFPWIKEFIDKNGLKVLESLLEKYSACYKKNAVTKHSDQDYQIQSQCVRCIKALMNSKIGRCNVLKSPSLILNIVFCLLFTPNNKLRTQVAEILAVLCVWSLDGHRLVVESFSDSCVINKEKYRFQCFMDTFKTKGDADGEEEDSTSIEYKVAGLSLVNAIVNKPDQIEERILLREEFGRRGIYNYFTIIENSDPPDSLINQIDVYREENKKDLAELHNMAHGIVENANNPPYMIYELLRQTENDENLHTRIIDSLENFLKIICRFSNEQDRIEVLTIVEKFIEKIKTTNNVKEQWQSIMNDYNSSIQHIIGRKYSLVSGMITDQEIDSLKKSINNLNLKIKQQSGMVDKFKYTQNFDSNDENNNLDKKNTIFSLQASHSTPNLTQYDLPDLSSRSPQTSFFPNFKNLFRQQYQQSSSNNNTLSTTTTTSPTATTSPATSPATSTATSNASIIIDQQFKIDSSPILITNNNSSTPHFFSSKLQNSTTKINKPPPPIPLPKRKLTNRPLKQLFWNKFSVNEINKTVWQEIPSDSIPINFEELDELFAITLLDFSRANNIAIMLSKVKMSYSEIRDAILEIDDEKLSIENLKSIKKYVPTLQEQNLINQYTGDLLALGNAENYFKNIIMIPRLAERLTCMIFRRKFENKVQKLVPKINVLRKAFTEIKTSRKFKKLLKTVLVIGNYLNTSSFRGNASGFQLDALLKMKDTKVMDINNEKGIATLLHYLVYTLEMYQNDIMNFMEELPNLEASVRISTTSVLSSVKSLFSGISRIENELGILKQLPLLSSTTNSEIKDNFIIVMSEFIQIARPTIEKIKNMTNELEEESKKILIYYYGENPDDKKVEDLLGLILTFSSSFMKAKNENEEFIKRKIQKAKDDQSKQQFDTLSINSLNDEQDNFDDTIKELLSGNTWRRRSRSYITES
ncbi:13110_t:CDS:10 [Entrophospora sp. SA101]|nr:13110_t:CDS:10 [Entrophospora sp. SA101]